MQTDTEMGNTQRLRVLLVDDVQENLELLEDVLLENGYSALLARNGMDALDQLRTEEVHIIVADAMMPKMDGFQLCKEVRADPSCAKIPFIIYTGNYVDGGDQEFARSIGVDRYVVKYAGLNALVDAVNELAQQNYGHRSEIQKKAPDQIDDQAFLEKHHEIVIKKLEEKMAELEMYADTLVRKNREIQSSEDRYRALFDHASIAIFVIDRASGKILDANRQGLALLGYPKEELLGMPGLPFVERGEFARDILQAHDYSSGETSIQTKDGEVLNIDVGVGPVTRPQDTRILLYIRDITEQKKMREQLMQAEKMTLMGHLAAGIAHEIRNPLAAISLNLQFLMQKCEPTCQSLESLKDALEGARRVEAVIENTLNLARVTPPVLKQENMNDLVNQVMGFLKISVQQKDIKIDTFLADNLPPIMADAKQIHQVILNVVQNAIDASEEQGLVTLSTGLLEDVHQEEGVPPKKVLVAIRDCGVGISPEQTKNLFKQFRTTKRGGTGLGLALSKQIMDRHNGEIRIEPAPGAGTIVRLIFPIHS